MIPEILNYPIPKPSPPTRRREIAEEDFKIWIKQAGGFYEMNESAIEKDHSRIASFNLQQVAEMC